MKRTFISGYTLVELLVSVVIFSGILGTVFSVIGSVRRTERFRDSSTALTQAANYGFEPMARAVGEADAVTCLRFGAADYRVRGFYLSGANPTQVQEGGGPLTTILVDKQKTSAGTVEIKWVRRDYYVSADSLYEKTYESPASSADASATACTSITWTEVADRRLTPTGIKVTDLAFRVVPPLLKDDASKLVRQAPFATIGLTVDHVVHRQGIAPMTLETTVVPTFSYGERRE